MGAKVYTTHSFFSTNNVASTGYKYLNNSAWNTIEAAYSGEIKVSGCSSKTLQVNVETFAATTTILTYRVEGRLEGMTSYGNMLTATFIAIPAIGRITEIEESVDYIRVGLKRAGTGVNSVSVAMFLGEE